MRRTEVIEQIKDIIRHVAPTAKTILYGSQARNEARSDSDIDLLILLAFESLPFDFPPQIARIVFTHCLIL